MTTAQKVVPIVRRQVVFLYSLCVSSSGFSAGPLDSYWQDLLHKRQLGSAARALGLIMGNKHTSDLFFAADLEGHYGQDGLDPKAVIKAVEENEIPLWSMEGW